MIQKIAIVSLSAGTIGEPFVKHEVQIGLKRLAEFGVETVFMPNAIKGRDYVQQHPEKRADDLIQAFEDDSVDMILCAIGGDDTYRLLPYLFENDRLKNALKKKVFLGFSDSTVNHLMLHKLGLNTFYGQSFLADVCELDTDMLPYSKGCFSELLQTGRIQEIRPSEFWYETRTDFSESAVGTPLAAHCNSGFELLQGPPQFSGKILGGCLETLYDIFDNTRYADSVSLCSQYVLFPQKDDWKGRILLLETSEELSKPEHYRKMVRTLKNTGIFGEISGILCGKPVNELYYNEYKQILKEEIDDPRLPIVANINVGHAEPRRIIPFGVDAAVDTIQQLIRFTY